MSTPQTFITTDRACDQCEYNLKGLPTDGKCPECGASIRRRPTRTSGTMSQEAPTSFVNKLTLGFTLAMIGMLLTSAGQLIVIMYGVSNYMTYIFYPMNPKALVTAGMFKLPGALIWVIGISIIIAKRPNRESIIHDKTLDNDQFRKAVLLVSIAWPIYALMGLAMARLNIAAVTPSTALTIPISIVSVSSGMIAWVGLIPTCVYFAELGYWASHDHLAQRLRGAAWTMATFGIFVVLLSAIRAMSGSMGAAAGFVSIFAFMILCVALLVFLFTVIQLRSVMKWVANHQELTAGSADRVRERVERDIHSSGVITTGLVCRVCKYDLNGSPFGGCCPECGESYADLTPLPILDPAKMHTNRDESEINIEEGENKGIYFNQELDASGKPKASGVAFTPEISDIPDEGDIPLFDSALDAEDPIDPDPKNTPSNNT